MNGVELFYAGEQGLVVEFGKDVDKTVNHKVHNLTKKLINKANKAILEIVPTYRSLLVYFDPIIMKRKDLIAQVENLLMSEDWELPSAEKAEKAKTVHIPVCYQEKFAPDLAFVAEYNKISADEVVRIHTSTPYLVYMLGFTPGFPYLGGMSPKIATPRLDKPRVQIPAGSVGIAGSQTGFYPIESPGGWRLIGRTPVKAFNPVTTNPFLFAAGDYLQFEPISVEEYNHIRKQVDIGKYLPKISEL